MVKMCERNQIIPQLSELIKTPKIIVHFTISSLYSWRTSGSCVGLKSSCDPVHLRDWPVGSLACLCNSIVIMIVTVSPNIIRIWV